MLSMYSKRKVKSSKRETKRNRVQNRKASDPQRSAERDDQPQPPPETARFPFIWEDHDPKLPYVMFGYKIFKNDDELARIIEVPRRKFKVGDLVQGEKFKYTIQEALGKHSYAVRSNNPNDKHPGAVLRVETTAPIWEGPILLRECLFLLLSSSAPVSFRTHFMKLIDQTRDTPSVPYGAFVVNRCNYSLADIRAKKLNGAEFSTQTAIRLCMTTLQAIHDVRWCKYVHRNICPKSFFVGNSSKQESSKIFISGFGYSIDTMGRDVEAGFPVFKKLHKTRLLNAAFQSRAYHRSEETNFFCVDMDSWIFMCYDFFSTKALPWTQSNKPLLECELLNQKEAFFSGEYDDHFDSLGIPHRLHKIRQRIAFLRHDDTINYSFFAHMILQMANEKKVDWKKKYEWQDPANGALLQAEEDYFYYYEAKM